MFVKIFRSPLHEILYTFGFNTRTLAVSKYKKKISFTSFQLRFSKIYFPQITFAI